MARVQCPCCGERLAFGNRRAVVLAREVDHLLGQVRRHRGAAGGVDLPSDAEAEGLDPDRLVGRGEAVLADLHDHIHQVAHLKGTPELGLVAERAEQWMARAQRVAVR